MSQRNFNKLCYNIGFRPVTGLVPKVLEVPEVPEVPKVPEVKGVI